MIRDWDPIEYLLLAAAAAVILLALAIRWGVDLPSIVDFISAQLRSARAPIP